MYPFVKLNSTDSDDIVMMTTFTKNVLIKRKTYTSLVHFITYMGVREFR